LFFHLSYLLFFYPLTSIFHFHLSLFSYLIFLLSFFLIRLFFFVILSSASPFSLLPSPPNRSHYLYG
jgi:hypothetical protein